MRLRLRIEAGFLRLALALVLVAGASAQAAEPAKSRFVAVPAASPPALELRDMQGRTHRLSDYRGKVVLVNFWATWCEPCRAEMPSLDRLRQRLNAGGKERLAVLAVNHGENEVQIGSFLAQQRLGLTILVDSFGNAWSAWKPGLLPASFLIGPDGTLRYRVLGELDWSGPEAVSITTRLLNESGAQPR
jgi:thiol-disulfide isomerase/thioredoxin